MRNLLFAHLLCFFRKDYKNETKLIKKTVSVFLSILLILTLTVGISAHEMYYIENGQPIPLKWSNTLNGRAYLRINGNGLNNSSNSYDYSEYVAQYNVQNPCGIIVQT